MDKKTNAEPIPRPADEEAPNPRFRTLVTARREALGLDQSGVEGIKGRSTVHRIESGQWNPKTGKWDHGSPKMIARLCMAVGVSPEEVIETMDDEGLARDVVMHMTYTALLQTSGHLEQVRLAGPLRDLPLPRAASQVPDLIALLDNGQAMKIRVAVSNASDGEGDGELKWLAVTTVADALKAAGLIVSIPA